MNVTEERKSRFKELVDPFLQCFTLAGSAKSICVPTLLHLYDLINSGQGSVHSVDYQICMSSPLITRF